MGEHHYRMSLGRKVTIGILCISILLGGVATLIGYSTYAEAMDAHYKIVASNVAKTAATQIDGDTIAGYLETLEKDDDYNRMLDFLFDIKESNDVLYLYVLQVDGPDCYYIMDADDEDSAYELGDKEVTAEILLPYTDHLADGLPTLITNGELGWLVTYHEPVLNSRGEVVAMVGVDISMNEVMADRHQFLLFVFLVMAITMLASVTAFVFAARKYVIGPINQLAAAASSFASGKKEVGASAISRLNIKTGDEIENLSETFKIMEHDIYEYIDSITKITVEKERIGAELSVATHIQASMLPCIFPAFPYRNEFDIFASMTPAKEVGGDFYDFFMIDDDRLGIVIADVSGKGVPAALFMVIAKTLIKNYAHTHAAPEEVFALTNETLCENNEAEMFVTAFMGILEIKTGRFVYVNAGHNYPLLHREGQGYDWIKASPGFVLAGMEGMRYKQYELTLEKGDRLFLYTDGVTEAVDRSDDLFGDDRLKQVLNADEAAGLSLSGLDCYIHEQIDGFVNGAEQADDITILILEYEGGGGRDSLRECPVGTGA